MLSSVGCCPITLIKALVDGGMRIRIITVDPECPLLGARDRDEERIPGSTSEDIRKLVEWLDALQSSGGSVSFRCIQTLPTEVVFRVDNRVFVSPYQSNRESQRSITYEYRKGGMGFEYYQTTS